MRNVKFWYFTSTCSLVYKTHRRISMRWSVEIQWEATQWSSCWISDARVDRSWCSRFDSLDHISIRLCWTDRLDSILSQKQHKLSSSHRASWKHTLKQQQNDCQTLHTVHTTTALASTTSPLIPSPSSHNPQQTCLGAVRHPGDGVLWRWQGGLSGHVAMASCI